MCIRDRNQEVPYLLLSGGWDATVRTWDVRQQQQLPQPGTSEPAPYHSQDVYAVASHRSRPFTYVSASRDATIREWTIRDGPVRTLRAATRALAKERVLAIVQGTAAALGCRAEITYNQGYPATINDSGATEEFFAIAGSVIGVDAAERIEQATMGGEDFAYYGQAVPACFFFLGLKPADAATCPTLHQPDFDFNDEAIETGVRLMCELATRAESGV